MDRSTFLATTSVRRDMWFVLFKFSTSFRPRGYILPSQMHLKFFVLMMLLNVPGHTQPGMQEGFKQKNSESLKDDSSFECGEIRVLYNTYNMHSEETLMMSWLTTCVSRP